MLIGYAAISGIGLEKRLQVAHRLVCIEPSVVGRHRQDDRHAVVEHPVTDVNVK
jgi:hypothetical protein